MKHGKAAQEQGSGQAKQGQSKSFRAVLEQSKQVSFAFRHSLADFWASEGEHIDEKGESGYHKRQVESVGSLHKKILIKLI